MRDDNGGCLWWFIVIVTLLFSVGFSWWVSTSDLPEWFKFWLLK